MAELKLAGVALPSPKQLMVTGYPQDLVVQAVLDGKADAGIVRTGVIEKMVRQGRLRLTDLRIINPQQHPGFPLVCSTRLFPEWPFFALPHVDEKLVRKVAVTLLAAEHGTPAMQSAGIHGFSIPVDYQTAEQIMRELRVPPFDTSPFVTFADIWRHYRWWLIGITISTALILLLTLRLGVINSRLRASRSDLELARSTADAANHAKSEFLANMSHEIRTPMNGVIGSVQLLHHTELSGDQKELLGCIETSAENLLSLLNDILDLSKIEAGRIELEYTDFSLRTMLRQVLMIQKPRLRKKRLEVKLDLQDSVPDLLKGDQLRLKQILLNLLNNAIKFTEQGSITIHSTLLSAQEEKFLIRLTVEDTGIGIAPAAMDRIFSPFTQADSSMTRRFGGTGLGLTISRQLTELMGGRIWAESNEGTGSCFHLELPFEAGSRLPEAETQFTMPVRQGPPLKVLIAEDDEINARLIGMMLRQMGHQAETVEHGEQAVQRAQEESFDCILMDLHMPVMNGSEATQAIRKAEACSGVHVPIIALTANALRGARESYLAKGFDGYLTKPLNIRLLTAELARLTSGAAPNQAPA